MWLLIVTDMPKTYREDNPDALVVRPFADLRGIYKHDEVTWEVMRPSSLIIDVYDHGEKLRKDEEYRRWYHTDLKRCCIEEGWRSVKIFNRGDHITRYLSGRG